MGVHDVGGSFLATASGRGDVTTTVKMSTRKVTTDSLPWRWLLAGVAAVAMLVVIMVIVCGDDSGHGKGGSGKGGRDDASW